MDRPILFSAPMVRAILAGRKTQTRRLVKERHFSPEFRARCADIGVRAALDELPALPRPYGVAGDRLWVRETWGQVNGGEYDAFNGDYADLDFYSGPIKRGAGKVVYRADPGWEDYGDVAYWRPSIHMPRWASRITLDVLSVRVERLHDITEEDAKAEGVVVEELGAESGEMTARAAFRVLWKQINGDESWDANPWVWVLSFKRADAEARAA